MKRGSGVRSFNDLVLFRHLMSDVFKALRSLSLPRAVGAAGRSIGPRFRPGVVKLKNEDRPYFFNSPYRWLWNDKERTAVYVLGICAFLISDAVEQDRHRTVFDEAALQHLACQVVGANACTEFRHLGEGMLLWSEPKCIH